jgi:putative endonuclease
MAFYVYMLKSISNISKKTYVGYTVDISSRLKKHNLGIGAKATRGYKWKLIFKKKFLTKTDAMSYEYYLKKDKKKRKLIISKC